MVKGMARAGQTFGQPQWVESARRSLRFIHATLWKDGRLLATYKDGRAHLNAYLDDHAFLLDALIELMQTDFRIEDAGFAQALADLLLEQFEDRERGGFYFLSHDHERLIVRTKTGHDSATASGNGVAAFALQRLGHLLGEPRYLRAAERTIRLFHDGLTGNASGYASLLGALEEALTAPRIVVLRGSSPALAEWHTRLAAAYRPDTIVISLPGEIPGLPGALDKAAPADAAAVNARVCQGATCLPPISALAELERTITPTTTP